MKKIFLAIVLAIAFSAFANAQSEGIEVGNKFIDVKLANPEGKEIAHYKTAKFKNAKGFDIYSVSLDKSKEPWMAAIAKDKLVWENHVSDLKGWYSSAAATYGVSFIPQNFLIDGNGIIVGKNLRGEELDNALEKLVK